MKTKIIAEVAQGFEGSFKQSKLLIRFQKESDLPEKSNPFRRNEIPPDSFLAS